MKVMENEIFRTVKIKEWEKYEISTHGRLRNKKTGYILKPIQCNSALIYRINTAGGIPAKCIHHLIAITFFKDYNGIVGHKDGNKENNHISNLYLWKTDRKYDLKTIQKISNMIKNGKTNREIADVFNPDNRHNFVVTLTSIRNKEVYRDITSRYF